MTKGILLDLMRRERFTAGPNKSDWFNRDVVMLSLRKRNGVALWRDAENAESRFIPKLASASLEGLKIQWNQLRILFRSVVSTHIRNASRFLSEI